MDEGAGSGQDDARAAMLAHLIVALSLVIPPAVVAAPVGPVVRMSMVAPATDVQVYASVKVDAAGFGERRSGSRAWCRPPGVTSSSRQGIAGEE